jgi:hypothetical protein
VQQGQLVPQQQAQELQQVLQLLAWGQESALQVQQELQQQVLGQP